MSKYVSPLQTGLPHSLEAERMILGALLNGSADPSMVIAVLSEASFLPEYHRLIFRAVGDLAVSGVVDRSLVAQELQKRGHLESVGGLKRLVELDEGLPNVPNCEGYLRILIEKQTLRETIHACKSLASECLVTGEPSADLLARAQRALANLSKGEKTNWATPSEVIDQTPGGLQGLIAPVSQTGAITFPWPSVARMIPGLKGGDLCVLAGRPSHGKSCAALQVAWHCAQHGVPVAVNSLEMSREALILRLLAAIGRIDHEHLRSGHLDQGERLRVASAAAQLEEIPLWLNDVRAHTVSSVQLSLQRLANRGIKPKLFIIDHLQLMDTVARGTSRNEKIGDITASLKRLAGSEDMTILLISQLNRDCERERRPPHLADLRDSGSIEQDADQVIFVFRPEKLKPDRADLRGEAQFIVAKQRDGRTGEEWLVFLPEFQRFESKYQGDDTEWQNQRIS